MDVLLIRHAESGERDVAVYPDDDLRPVTVEGRRKMIRLARAMQLMGIRFDMIATSPLVRAVQTAEIVREVFDHERPADVSDTLGHACTPGNVIRLLEQYPNDATVVLVGHEPALSRVAAAMIGAPSETGIALKKGGSIGISFEGAATLGRGTQQFHLKPGHLKRVKDRDS